MTRTIGFIYLLQAKLYTTWSSLHIKFLHPLATTILFVDYLTILDSLCKKSHIFFILYLVHFNHHK